MTRKNRKEDQSRCMQIGTAIEVAPSVSQTDLLGSRHQRVPRFMILYLRLLPYFRPAGGSGGVCKVNPTFVRRRSLPVGRQRIGCADRCALALAFAAGP